VPGNAAPTSQDDFWFETPHGPSQVAVNQLTGGTTAEAVTGGGNVFFGGAGTPVLVNLSDGSSFVTSGPTPQAARSPSSSGGGGGGSGGGGGGGLASSAPSAGGDIPADAALLGINLAEPDANGNRDLTATVTDSLGNPLGTGTIGVPFGGWWVIGLTPDAVVPGPSNPPPTDPGPTDPPPTDPGPVGPPDPDPIGGGDPTTPPSTPDPDPPAPSDGPVAAPEPSTLMLFALGGLTLRAWRRGKSFQAE
jgi:hypothetical protein